MIRKITLLFLACLAFCVKSNGQGTPICGFDELHQQAMTQDPDYAQLVNQFKNKWVNWMATHQNLQSLIVTLPAGDSVYEIPVVVHILDTTNNHGVSRYNKTDAQIQSVIDYVNKTLDATWPAYPNTAYVPVRFALAKRDPSCNATTGINRINAVTALGGAIGATYNISGVGRPPASIGITDAQAKSIPGTNWPNLQYYNIWVINRINGINGIDPFSGSFIAGYAALPTFSNADGTIMLSSQFLSGNTVLTHELGHAFNLYHTFEGSTPPPGPPPGNQCPPNTNCAAQGDEICDTDPSNDKDPGVCPTIISCSGLPYSPGTQHNIMNYTNCPDRFTPLQSARIMNTVNDINGPRSCLISSLGATAPGLSAINASCSPSTVNPNNTNSGIYRVNISTPTNSVVYMNVISEGYSGDGTAYVDNTCKHIALLRAGATYRVTIETGSFPLPSENVLVYIDYNNDGIFQMTEQLLSSTNAQLHSNTFVVPATTATYCVPLRMRVISDQTSATLGACGNRSYGQVEDYSVLIKGSGTASNTHGLATIIQPPLEGNPSCRFVNVTVAATYQPTITPVWYKWYKKSATPPYTITEVKSSVDSFVMRNDWADLDTVWAKVAYPGLCGVDTTLTDSITLFRPLTVTPMVTIGLTKGTNPGCADDTLQFSVVGSVNPGPNATYEFFVNNVSQGVSTNKTITLPPPVPTGTPIYVKMYTNASPDQCFAPYEATSATIVYTHTFKVPTLSIALISGTNPGCPNQSLTFKATGTTAGTNPTYEWKKNGIIVQTGASNTYTAVFNNNDVIDCIMTSSSGCAVPNTANSSNTIVVTHTPLIADVTIQQIKGNSPACTGHEMVFVATPTNSGANPQFQWLVNNAPVAGANSPIYSTYTLLNGDFVSCILISTDPCVANTFDTSAILPMVITTSKSPTVTVAITRGNNPGCLDSLIEFTATDNNFGANPNFDWMVNGSPIFNGQVFSINTLLNGDVVTCRANQTDGGCYLPDTVTSAPITLTLSPTPEPPIISLVNNQLVTNKTGSFIWFGPAGQVTGGENGSFHPVELGQYYCVTNNNGCWSKPSNKLTITLLDISTYNINEVKIYPNPTTGEVSLDWGGKKVTMQVDVYSTVGQKLMHSDVINQAHTTLNLGQLANGIYFIVVTDEQGKSGTARITVTK